MATHILVRTSDGRGFELRLDHRSLCWTARTVDPPVRPA
jgi:hypothetical protein